MGLSQEQKYMTWSLQWIGESKLFATFEQVFEHDVQGVGGGSIITLFLQNNEKHKKILRY